jgi:hypothetical protein
MSDFFKKAVTILHDVLEPLTSKLNDPEAKLQFQQSLGYKPAADAKPPVFPDGSAMKRYLDNENPKEEEILLAQSFQEVAQVIDALKELYQTGADTYYAINPDESATRNERIQMAVSELTTLTLNIFTLNYVRLRHPILHNAFVISGIVDEMGQRAGGSGFLGSVMADFFVNFGRGFKLADEKGVNTAIETIGLLLNVLKFIYHDSDFFFSGGFETYQNSSKKFADNASKGILSMGWFYEHDPAIKGNLYLTLGLIPKTRAGGGFFAKVNSPGKFTKKFGENFSLTADAEGDLDFFYAKDIGFDVPPGEANRVSLLFKSNPKPKTLKILSSPELSVGYGHEHSIELRLGRDEIGIIGNSEISIKFGRGEATSFPMGFIPESQFEKTIPVLFGWTTKRGFFISDAGTIGPAPAKADKPDPEAVARDGEEAPAKPNLFFFNVPIRTGFKGLTFQNVHIGVGKQDATTILEASLDFSFVLGDAFTLSVTRIGARGYFTKRDDMKGIFNYDINLDFKTPTGIGISVDTGPVKGGGFLSIDKDKGEYIGALELAIDIKCIEFTVKAFGIIQTKLPDAPGEYSLFVVISTDFAPIPLLFGLTLNGVGGLFGHNRTADISLIQTEMRSPSLENILFLKDPIANITKLVTDAGRYFPAGIDKSLIGVSLIIGYAAVFELKIALIFLKPDKKILVPGFLKLETPKKSKILHLQVNFLGIIDQQEGYFFFRADLVESKFASFKLTGSLIFATGWGDNEGLFAISVGGFHPSFKNFPQIKALPNAFSGLDRLRISFWDEGKNHLYMECYLALTSNSRQLGAHIYLHVDGPAGFNIDGHLGFDILWETEPVCYFEAGIEARIDFRHKDEVLAGVSLKALFTGPTPKHIEGKAKLKICWFLSVSIPFSKTWGEPAPEVEVLSVDLNGLFLDQLNDDRNWRAEVPDFFHQHVSIRKSKGDNPAEMIIHPLGSLIFSQRELPLNQDIQKVGARIPNQVMRLSISRISAGGADFTDLKPTSELFAPGQFIELNEDEKLARPSFERMTSGVRIGDTGTSQFPMPFVKARNAQYELAYVAPDLPSRKEGEKVVAADVFQLFSQQSAVSQSNLALHGRLDRSAAPKPMQIKTPGFAIGGTEDLHLFKSNGEQGLFARSQTEAEQIKDELLKEQPALKGKIQVLPTYELLEQ